MPIGSSARTAPLVAGTERMFSRWVVTLPSVISSACETTGNNSPSAMTNATIALMDMQPLEGNVSRT
ncbi:Hypothetical protein NGAL_HAMBI490_18520 [Neorhizobium galegae bv. officinalis]|nr:Hypothetical protein NGAL_HAMBI490_18520 [Neorhizobium galegae bv. officinalis]